MVISKILARAARLAIAIGFDRDDAKTLIALSMRAVIVLGYAATFGLALRVFIATSGVGRVLGWDF